VGSLPVKDHEELKRTNEIKMAIPVLEAIDLEGKDVTADALLTQRKIAEYLVTERHAHYHFTVKGNQRGVLEEVALWFQDRKESDRPLPLNGTSPTKRRASALVK
jgi:predicted transposase YbfD/YdcC